MTPRISKARAGLIRRLADTDLAGKVLSVYVDLDPTEFATPPARESQVKSLTNEAEALVEELDQETRLPLREDVQLVRDFLLGDFDWASEARAVAIFASSENGMFDVIKLPESVPQGVFVDDGPHVLPLRELVEQKKWCVLLADRQVGRIFVGSPLRLKEYEEIEDEVHGQHQKGGWSQRRYENSVEEDVEDHLKHVSDRLFELHKRMKFDHFVIGAREELWPRISDRLHSYVAEHTVGRIDVDPQMATIEELQEQLKIIAAQQEAEREQELIGTLKEGLANKSRAAAGFEPVLAALNEARVETLLLAEGFNASGVTCPSCGFLGATDNVCPVDGGSTEKLTSILERIIERTDELSGDTVTVRNPRALDTAGGIAAILRF
ncbi:MAG TPA: Vms1/Ankzf1 family peptidyl-tRNA hydrolase [Actinomycetota bacterium]|nr:Vms1/Ankzf1 family peptidyl-tRNA hydrolase [Actinomycetota bacterium]